MRTTLVLIAAFFAFSAVYLTLDCLHYGETVLQYAVILALDLTCAYGVAQCFALLVRDIVNEQ